MASQDLCAHSTQYCISTSYLPPEIIDVIFYQLKLDNSREAKRALLSCLWVSKYFRDIASHYIFRSIRVNSNLNSSPHDLERLLEILAPSSSQAKWMSILPYIYQFSLSVSYYHRQLLMDMDLLFSCLRRLSAALSEDPTRTRRLTTLVLRFNLNSLRRDGLDFTTELQGPVRSLLKMPHLESVEISGADFLSPDILHDTHFSELDISECSPRHLHDSDAVGNFRLRSLVTDTTFPPKVKTPDMQRLLGRLDHLEILFKNDSEHTFRKAGDILRFAPASKTLTLVFLVLYSESWPWIDWQIDFGEFEALETLKITSVIDYIDEEDGDDELIPPTAELALEILFGVLNAIHQPMRQLAHLRWDYSLGTSSGREYPFLSLEKVLRSSSFWRGLDERVTSSLFPVLHGVELVLSPPLFQANGDVSDVDRQLSLDLSIASLIQKVKEEMFPLSVAAFKENLKLVVNP